MLKHRRITIMIIDKEGLLEWKTRAVRQPEGRTVLDLEADSLHRYQEKLCLIQYADAEGTQLIDPLPIEDISPFSSWLRESTIWMHGADYDMNLMLDAWECLPAMILDTQIAARLLGFRQFGLAALVEHFFNVTLSKSSQKADWGKRPLPEKMLEYARNDVRYMLSMADMLTKQLKEKGRYDWFLESCQVAMQKAMQRHETCDDDRWRIQGSGKLTRRGLAALKSLWEWRNKEAAVWNKPSFMVCSNNDLITWSAKLQERQEVSPPSRFHPRRRQRLLSTINQFHCMDEEEYPHRVIQGTKRIKTEEFELALSLLTEKRNAIAEQLDLDASLIAPRAILESIAEHPEKASQHLMQWQKKLLELT